MSLTEAAEISSDFGTIRPEPVVRTPARARGDSYAPMNPVLAEDESTDRLSELVRRSGIDLSPEELRELRILGDYLDRHVEPDGNCDVQCMLLWNEWVRVFRRQTSGFPNLIKEKEFQSVITGLFSTPIASNGWRGLVYAGVRYVP